MRHAWLWRYGRRRSEPWLTLRTSHLNPGILYSTLTSTTLDLSPPTLCWALYLQYSSLPSCQDLEHGPRTCSWLDILAHREGSTLSQAQHACPPSLPLLRTSSSRLHTSFVMALPHTQSLRRQVVPLQIRDTPRRFYQSTPPSEMWLPTSSPGPTPATLQPVCVPSSIFFRRRLHIHSAALSIAVQHSR